MSGTLYLIATPIGNMEDITFRAVRILSEADLVYAEDTRRSAQLLSHFKIKKPILSYHEFNEGRRDQGLIEKLTSGLNIALISDAGTPGISDPGFRAVRSCIENNLPVVGIPGACAAILALSASGLPTDEFHFVGFLPQKISGCERRLLELQNTPGTLVIYESPYRVVRTLKALSQHFPTRKVVVSRELTKKFEEIRRGLAQELLEHFEKYNPRGEFVILMEGFMSRKKSQDDAEVVE